MAIVNAEAHKLYEDILNSKDTFDKNKSCTSVENYNLAVASESLARLNIDNPFDVDAEHSAHNHYFDLLYFYEKWPRGRGDCAFRLRFMLAAKEMADSHPENPFTCEEQEKTEEIFDVSKDNIFVGENDELQNDAKNIIAEQENREDFVTTKENEKIVLGIARSKKNAFKNRRNRK